MTAGVSELPVASRVRNLPAYLFAELDEKVSAARAAGIELISLGSGQPDQATPTFIVEELARAARDPSTHRYPDFHGLREFRCAVADFYRGRFGVTLDPDTQVLPLIGSKEGIAHLPWAVTDPGDPVLICEPAYPIYTTTTLLAGAHPVPVPLRATNSWFPDLGAIDPTLADRARIMWLNYPANPTGAVATLEQLGWAVEFAAAHRLLLAYDNAYSELTYDGFTAPSIMQIPGAADISVEFGTLSKTFNMMGWRLGWVVGNRQVVATLGRLKTHLDSGVFTAVQRAGVAALDSGLPHLPELVATYQRRRDRIISRLHEIGVELAAPRGAMYVWLPTPRGESGMAFTARLVEQARIVVAPGTGYGSCGEGYVRLSLGVPDAQLEEGLDRIVTVLGSD